MSDLTLSESRALARVQREVREALRRGDPEGIADAQARRDELLHDFYEGDDGNE